MRQSSPHPFRFGVVAARAATGDEWIALARRVEALGYSTLLMPDRVGRVLAPFPALGVAAAATRELRVGTFVLASGIYNPTILAAETATLDFLSNGRFEVGLGTGVSEDDYRRTGHEYGRPGTRIDRLADTLRVLKASFGPPANPAVQRGAANYPRPVQQPHPPILIAGAGPRLLGLAAREADIVAFGLGGLATEADFAEKIALVRQEAGERFLALELSLNLLAVVAGPVAPAVRERLRWLQNVELEALVQANSPLVVTGDAEAMSDQLRARRERLGVSYITVSADQMEEFAPVVARLTGR
ncbi:MAG TPA: TIGR03621 family F420-dependent LLM class oxidoreductase [Chloroflexota bacterium]|nr:TIGR03621 family F420-dependent LLM class oxidoreductase [Chloroflexota bacterium]